MHDEFLLRTAERRLREAGGLAIRTVRDGVLEITVPGRSARVQVREHRTATEQALVLLAPICAEHQVEPRAVLQLVARMGAGAIALLDGGYVARFTVPAAKVAVAPLETAIAYVADLASSLGAMLAPVVIADPVALSHYAD